MTKETLEAMTPKERAVTELLLEISQRLKNLAVAMDKLIGE